MTALQAINVFALAFSAGATLFATERLDHHISRDRIAGRPSGAIVRLSDQLNRHSESIAELLLPNRMVFDDFSKARADVDAWRAGLQPLIERDIALVRDPW